MKFLTIFLLMLATASNAQEQTFTLSSTTSTQNSGLYDYLLPMFTADTGISVKVIAVGTGQAIRIAENGDADALLVHHRTSEDAFVASGFGAQRFDVMYNDFVLIGPKTPPLDIGTIETFFHNAASTGAYPFISRGDDSGTHKKEVELWAKFNGSQPKGHWYREIGSGMGATLNMAASIDAYTISDRGTWLAFGNKRNLEIKWAGDDILLNPYGLILVNPEKFPHVEADNARIFANWMTSPLGQKAIGDFRVDGKQLFCPDADKTHAEKIIACPAR
jgi:tungstate transport system substrate-binding protein